MVILFYKLQDEVNDVKKTRTLTAVQGVYPLTVTGTLRTATSKINPVIDFQHDITYFDNYNYCYIADFNRYYFVDNAISIRNGVTSLSLRVDVLTSFLTLNNISTLKCFVGRCNNSNLFDLSIPDNLLQFKGKPVVRCLEPSSGLNNCENVTFEMNPSNDVVISTVTNKLPSGTLYGNITIPEPLRGLAGVTTISFSKFRPSGNNATYVTSHYNSKLNTLLVKALDRDDIASAINNIVAFPFSVEHSETETEVYYLEDVVTDPSTHADIKLPLALNINSGYKVLKDFTFSHVNYSDSDFRAFEPYSKCEIFIPFVGWFNINIKENLGCRLIVFYNVDYISGQATAYIYNYTKNSIIFQNSCQLGVNIPFNASNMRENELKDQNYTRTYYTGMATSLATTIVGAGLTLSGAGAGVGIGMMLGGATMGSTTFVNFINNENLLIDKAGGQVSNPTGVSGNFSGFEVLTKWTYYETLNYETTAQKLIFNEQLGKPTNKLCELGDVPVNTNYHTYCEILDLHTTTEDGSHSLGDITYSEISELKQACMSGIYL